jgi:hypothetical protein
MRRSPSNRRYSPRQALHTRFAPKMEIIGSNFNSFSLDNKPKASDMLMLPKQGIFGTLTKGLSTLNKAIDKGQQYHQQATQLYNKASDVHQQATQVYNKGKQLYQQPPQPYPQQPQVFSQPPQPYPQQPIIIPQPKMRVHSLIKKKNCSYRQK